MGRYINMDPSLTELVISQTQFIRFGQIFFGWICDNLLNFPSIIADNIKVENWSQLNFVVDIYLFSISILGRRELTSPDQPSPAQPRQADAGWGWTMVLVPRLARQWDTGDPINSIWSIVPDCKIFHWSADINIWVSTLAICQEWVLPALEDENG